MNITQEHVNIAFEIDSKYKELDEAGLDNASLLVEMYDLMPKFKKLLDELSNDDFNHLSHQFIGFYDYAKYIEWIATQIASGEIQSTPVINIYLFEGLVNFSQNQNFYIILLQININY